MCKKKRRWLRREDRDVMLGFNAYREFYKRHYKQHQKTYEQFMNSNYFDSFVKFGKHIIDINAVNPVEFINFIINSAIPLNKWCYNSVYEQYVIWLTSQETPERALERNMLLMEQWALDNNEEWTDFFRKIDTTVAMNYIRTGRISPWLLYNTETGQELLDRLRDDQLVLIQKVLNPYKWNAKFKKHKDDVENIYTVCKKAGL